MSERGTQLLETANGQIDVISLLSRHGHAVLSLPCPGREKLRDGTVAAVASHAADNYMRIAEFPRATSQTSTARPGRLGSSRPPLADGHTPNRGAGHDQGTHSGDHTPGDNDLHGLLDRLSAGRDALGLLADLSHEQFDTAPPAGSFRFCDGQRTLEQVIASLLKHQAHQIDAIKAAIA